MSTPVTPRNADRVLSPVLSRSAILALLGIAAALGLDLNLSEDQVGALSDAALIVLPLLGSLIGAVWGAIRARERVTPLGPQDTPRDLDGTELVRLDGKPLAAVAHARENLAEELEERVEPPRLQPRYPRVDRHEYDRDPGDLG